MGKDYNLKIKIRLKNMNKALRNYNPYFIISSYIQF